LIGQVSKTVPTYKASDKSLKLDAATLNYRLWWSESLYEENQALDLMTPAQKIDAIE
jgi:hypothetical protein